MITSARRAAPLLHPHRRVTPRHAQDHDFAEALPSPWTGHVRNGDFYPAKNGDLNPATSGDFFFFTATDKTRPPRSAYRPRASCRDWPP